MRCVAGLTIALTLIAAGAVSAAAQDSVRSIPAHYPLNPMSASRSGLFAQPYLPTSSGWRRTLSVDYASAVEWEETEDGARYVLDAELMRTRLTFSRDLSPSRFFQLGLDVSGAFNGFADGAFDWYHSTIGIGFLGREMRPRNQFRYSLRLSNGIAFERERPDYYLGDVQLAYGVRHGTAHQTTLAATIPTSTAPVGYTKDTYSLAAIHTMRVDPHPRVHLEGSVGVGYTPRVGELAPHQLTLFNSTSVAATLRLFGSGRLYGYLFTHNALYDDTMLPELETREWTGDFGWMWRTAGGRELRLGFTEDFGPKDAGIDLILRFSTSW